MTWPKYWSECNKRKKLQGCESLTEIKGGTMKRIILAVLMTSFAFSAAIAQSCESKAVSADGKPLHGAAKTSFVKKCKKDACEGKAVSSEGKPLYGAAKRSFMAKCGRAA
jgi:hypothetical protein